MAFIFWHLFRAKIGACRNQVEEHWPLLARSSVYASGLMYVLFLTRILGPLEFGRYVYLSSFVELLALLIGLGSPQIVMKESYRTSEINVGQSAVLCIIPALLVFVLGTLQSGQPLADWTIFALLGYGTAIDITLMNGAIAVGSAKLPLFDFTIRYFVASLALVGAWSFNFPISSYFALTVQILPIGLTIGLYLTLNRDRISYIARKNQLPVWRERAGFTGASLISFGIRRLDLLILGALSLDDQLAILRIALLLSEVPFAMAQAQLSSSIKDFFPKRSLKRIFVRAGRSKFRKIAGIGIMLQVGMMFAAPGFSLIFFGDLRLVVPLLVVSIAMLIRLPCFPAEVALLLHAKPLVVVSASLALLLLKAILVTVASRVIPEQVYIYLLAFSVMEVIVTEAALASTFRAGILSELAIVGRKLIGVSR